jgi:hypothetical protein
MNNGKTEKEIAEWVVTNCLFFGTSVTTAHSVAAIFVEGLQSDRYRQSKASEFPRP